MCYFIRNLFYFSLLFFILASFNHSFFVHADDSDVIITVTLFQCYDGIDNDSDGLIDYPNDPGCLPSGDDNETDPTSCGDETCNGDETCSTCPADCGACCGNGTCAGDETCSSCPADCGVCSSGGGGGGGGVYIPSGTAEVIFEGRAFPARVVTLLKDAQVIASTVAGSDANFKINLPNLSAENYIFSLYSEDKNGNRSSLLSFPISVTAGATTNISGIFIAPTIDVNKEEVKRGDNIAIFGQSVPLGDIIIVVSSDEEFFARTISDKDGIYLYNFDSSVLEYGSHSTKSKASVGNQLVSGFSYAINFKVGTVNITKVKPAVLRGDLNKDSRVNIIDYSIMAYWYQRPLPPAHVDLNSDGKIDLIDFSIMVYYWTG